MNKSLLAIVAVCSGAVPVSALAATPASAATSAGGAGARYVALGDSYSSGEGNAPFLDAGGPGTCDRSVTGSYADTIASDLSLTDDGSDFDFEACSGATTGDLWPGAADPRGNNSFKTYQETGLTGGEAGLGTNTKLVTLTIGGNDVGFATTLEECVVGGCLIPSLSPYSDVRNAVRNIAALAPKLAATYRSIELAAPNAAGSIYVLGYPGLFSDSYQEDSTLRCLANTGMTARSIQWLYQRQLQLDAVIKAATQIAGVHYVDPSAVESFTGHDICSANAWFHPLWQNVLPISDLVYAFHPTVAGQQAMAAALVAAGATGVQ